MPKVEPFEVVQTPEGWWVAECPICGEKFVERARGLATAAVRRHAWWKHGVKL